MNQIGPLTICDPAGKTLLKDVVLPFTGGRRLVITGPNGCGKSTLLRYLAGIESAACSVTLPFESSQVAYLPTRPLDFLLPWASVEKNIRFFCGLPKARSIDWRAQLELLTQSLNVNISKMREINAYSLSSGQQALLALIIAMNHDGSILLADEVLSNLSTTSKVIAASMLNDFNGFLIASSHDPGAADLLNADQIGLEQFIDEHISK